MAVLKCKMCGGDLDINAGVSVVECEYCGTKQTVPSADDEKKITLFGRANRLRFACEFDKAAGVYESIIADFPEEAEAYWGLVLCKYGIEYVDDPATAKKIPTCHRSSFDPVLDDSNFEQVLENADVIARGVYREEAKQIEELRKGIIEVSSKEEPYDIFICYKETDENGDRTVDSIIAQDVYTELVNKGYRVFFSRITLEDKLGQEYEPYIFAALNSAKIMLAFGTDYEYYNAVWVKNEWSRFLQFIASGEKKTLIPCYKDLDAYDMPKEFAKLQAQDMGKVGAIQDLLRGIEKILPRETSKTETVVIQQSAINPTLDSLIERAFMFLEDEEWDRADEYCEKVLDIDPKCAKAYLGKMMKNFHISALEQLATYEFPLENSPFYEKVLKYADNDLAEKIKEYNKTIICKPKYKEAKELLCSNYRPISSLKEAIELLESIGDFKDSFELLEHAKKKLEKLIDDKKSSTNETFEKIAEIGNIQNYVSNVFCYPVALREDGTVLTVDESDSEEIATIKNWDNLVKIIGDMHYAIGLHSDGSVIALGDIDEEFLKVDGWTDIVDIVSSGCHTVGLKSDGTVVAVGDNDDSQCNVSDWKDVIEIGVDISTTYGLKEDGTVLCTGDYNEFEDFDDIISISKPEANFVLHEDGIVFGTLTASEGEENEWVDIVAISSNRSHVVGLKSDGTVVAAGRNEYGECDVSDWSNIICVYASEFSTYGIKEDGTIVVVGSDSKYLDEIITWKLFNGTRAIENKTKSINRNLTQTQEDNMPMMIEDVRNEIKLSKNISKVCSAGTRYIVALNSDGTAMSVGENEDGRCDVHTWNSVVEISARYGHTLGLKSNGTVVATGYNDEDGQCDVEDWNNIVAISAGYYHSVGLKSDGTVVANGANNSGQCNVNEWTDIVSIATGLYHTVGLKSDGTVVATGNNDNGQCNVDDWHDIVEIYKSGKNTLGLTKNGKVALAGRFSEKVRSEVKTWANIVFLSAFENTIYGVKKDGTVVVAGKVEKEEKEELDGWKNIIAIYSSDYHTVGLKSDGTVMVVGDYGYSQKDIQKWQLFNDLENKNQQILEQRRIAEENRKQQLLEEQRIAEENRKLLEKQRIEEENKAQKHKELINSRKAQGLCQHCGGTFRGLFTKKCSSCGKEKDY